MDIPSNSELSEYITGENESLTIKEFDLLYAALLAEIEFCENDLDRREWRIRPPALGLENHETHLDLTRRIVAATRSANRMQKLYMARPWQRWWATRRHQGRIHTSPECRTLHRMRRDWATKGGEHQTWLELRYELSGHLASELKPGFPDYDAWSHPTCRACTDPADWQAR